MQFTQTLGESRITLGSLAVLRGNLACRSMGVLLCLVYEPVDGA